MFKLLLSPAKIGKLELSNRMVVPAMVTCHSDGDFMVNDRSIAYMEEKAKGGWGMIITEGRMVSRAGIAFGLSLGLFDDKMLEGERKLTDAVHRAGSKVCAQLMHSGRQSIFFKDHKMASAPSPIKDFTLTYTPKEMTAEDIRQTVRDYAKAAGRAKEAGFDAVEIHGAHGYLLHEFVSPASNKRTDEYGGSLEGRTKFPLEVVKAVREEVGEDFPVIYRLSAHERMPNGEGIVVADSMAFAIMLEAAGVDAIHATVGNYETEKFQIAPSAVERALNSSYSEELKKVIDIPVICVGKFTEPYLAEAMLKAGKCDFVAMGRQSLADPYFPKKVAEGRNDDICHCIGCQIGCLMHLKADKPIACTVNPRLGYEYMYPETVPERKKKVIVAGGGIGGMEAAITAAQRGHEVTLYEKSDRLGGQWNIAAVPPYKQDLASLSVWQQNQLRKLGVTVCLGVEADADLILAQKPDEVIVATGAVPMMPPFKGIDNSNVYNSFEVLRGEKIVSGKTAIIGGGDVGCETANFLASTNRETVIFEMMPELSSKMERGVQFFLHEYMDQHHVEVHTGAKVLELKNDSVIYEQDGIAKEYGGISDIVIAIGQKSCHSLAKELEGKVSVHVIGDADAVGHGIDAVHAGYDAAYRL